MRLLTVSLVTTAILAATTGVASARTFGPTCIGTVAPCIPADGDDLEKAQHVTCELPLCPFSVKGLAGI